MDAKSKTLLEQLESLCKQTLRNSKQPDDLIWAIYHLAWAAAVRKRINEKA